MPFDFVDSVTPRGRVEISAAIELSWLVIGCSKRNAVHPLPDELIQATDRFWDDDHPMEPEVLLVAQQLGCLTGPDIDPLFSLGERRIAPIADIALESEYPETRAIVASRIDRLRKSRALRGRYSELLKAIWDDAAPAWDGAGRVTAERAVLRMRAAVEHGLQPFALVPENHCSRKPLFTEMVGSAEANGSLLLSPCYFAGQHGHIVALPGVLSIAIGTGVSGDIARRRADAERVAAEIKLMGDATRVLIVGELRREPATVGQIAQRVGVSQPTASVHLRQLREAGVLTAQRAGASSIYRVQPERLAEILDRARTALVDDVAV